MLGGIYIPTCFVLSLDVLLFYCHM